MYCQALWGLTTRKTENFLTLRAFDIEGQLLQRVSNPIKIANKLGLSSDKLYRS
jgi:hypothetical protein